MTKNKVIKNTFWIIGCRIVQAFFALVINMLTARYMGPSNYGLINYAASLVAFVTPIMNLGINNVLVNEIIKYPDKEGETIGTSMALSVFSAVCCIAGLAAFVSVANAGETETLIVCVLYSLLLISQSFELVQYWFQAKLWSKYSSVSVLVAYLIVSAYKIYLLVARKAIYWFAVSNALDYFLIALFLIIIYKYKKGQKLSFSFETAKRIFGQSKHYIIAGMMGVVLAQSDRIMLKIMNGNEAVGLYSAACTIAGITSFVFSAIVDSMRPNVLEHKMKNDTLYKDSVSRLFGIVTYLSLAQSVFITLFASLVVYVMYGSDYMSAVPTLQIVVWYTSFSYIGAARSVWILAEEKQKYLWIVSLSGMLVNIGLNFALIPLWGINGAALATLITQILSNVVINSFIKPLKEVNTLLVKGFNVKRIFNR